MRVRNSLAIPLFVLLAVAASGCILPINDIESDGQMDNCVWFMQYAMEECELISRQPEEETWEDVCRNHCHGFDENIQLKKLKTIPCEQAIKSLPCEVLPLVSTPYDIPDSVVDSGTKDALYNNCGWIGKLGCDFMAGN